jgi:hypothetical protein
VKWGNGRGRLKYGPMTGGSRNGVNYGTHTSMNPYFSRPYGANEVLGIFGKPFGFGRGVGFGHGFGRGSGRGRGRFICGW